MEYQFMFVCGYVTHSYTNLTHIYFKVVHITFAFLAGYSFKSDIVWSEEKFRIQLTVND